LQITAAITHESAILQRPRWLQPLADPSPTNE